MRVPSSKPHQLRPRWCIYDVTERPQHHWTFHFCCDVGDQIAHLSSCPPTLSLSGPYRARKLVSQCSYVKPRLGQGECNLVSEQAAAGLQCWFSSSQRYNHRRLQFPHHLTLSSFPSKPHAKRIKWAASMCIAPFAAAHSNYTGNPGKILSARTIPMCWTIPRTQSWLG